MDSAIAMNQPVVIDNGSGLIKAGFAGEQIPKCRFRSCIGRPKHERVMAGALEGDTFIGPRCEEHRGLFKLNYPIEHGIVNNWDDMEAIWKYLYTKEQLGAKSSDHPVLLTEAPNNPMKHREKAAEIMFEHLSVPALFISIQAVLSLYASGRTTGCVLDSGDGVTHAVPVYEGFALNESIQRVDIAGRDITNYLKLLLRKEGYKFSSSAEMETVRTIKEKTCFLVPEMEPALHQAAKAYMTLQTPASVTSAVSSSSTETSKLNKSNLKKDALKSKNNASSGGGDNATNNINQDYFNPCVPRRYVLPDGKKIELFTSRFKAPEVLFRPDLIGQEELGIHQILYFAIQKSDLDLRSSLYQNIVLSGGTSLFQGFGNRLFKEIKDLVIDEEVKVKINAPAERIFSTWLGGSILASLDTFRRMWTTKENYENEGARRMFLKKMI